MGVAQVTFIVEEPVKPDSFMGTFQAGLRTGGEA
jgi:hypothetical protein